MADLAKSHGTHEREIAALFAARDQLQGELGIADPHAMASAAITGELKTSGEAAGEAGPSSSTGSTSSPWTSCSWER